MCQVEEEHGGEVQEAEKVSHEGYTRPEAGLCEPLEPFEVTDELRVERLLERCSREGFEVTIPEVKLVLQQEEAGSGSRGFKEACQGHVGKSMIRLRREKSACVPRVLGRWLKLLASWKVGSNPAHGNRVCWRNWVYRDQNRSK